MTYDALLTLHDKVRLLPEPVDVVVVKLAMLGAAPCGTLEAV